MAHWCGTLKLRREKEEEDRRRRRPEPRTDEKMTMHRIAAGDKTIELAVGDVRVWVDYDDVDHKEARAVAEKIKRTYNAERPE